MGGSQTSAGMAAFGTAVASILIWASELGLGHFTTGWAEPIKDIPQGIETSIQVVLVFVLARLLPGDIPTALGQTPNH